MPTLGEMESIDSNARDEFQELIARTESKPLSGLLHTPLLKAPMKAPGSSNLQSSPPSPQLASESGSMAPGYQGPTTQQRSKNLPPSLLACVHSIISDLESRPSYLMGLNPSRRDAICAHLNRLSNGAGRPNLNAWLQTNRTPNESQALFSFFEEIALMAIGQSILLKRWSDRGLRPFRPEHLGKLNFELSTALRPHVPLQRESFHLTRPNFYSWYSPPVSLQSELFKVLEEIDFRDESPLFLLELCTDGRRYSPDWPELLGYDSRFYREATNELLRWSNMARTSSAKRKVAFTSTLRLGQVTHGNTTETQWIGCEENTFALLISEMVDLWWGPKGPPVWSNNSSLEAHPKEQLSLVAQGSKPGVLSLLSDMEACDFGWVAEERCVKANRNKALLDGLPFFKKLRAPGTHMGTLQACVAITKIRPGGRLLWVREEPLTQDEGTEALSFLLGRAKLLAEVDLSHVDHSLPTRRPLFPRYLYVFERELKHEVRLAHRPIRWLGQGSIKSHVEISLFLTDVLATVPMKSPDSTELPALPSRTNWKLSAQTSPFAQKDWMTRWPDPSSAESLSNLEALSRGTVPLATLATIRSIHKASTDLKNSIDPAQPALFIESRPEVRLDGKTETRRLAVMPFRELVAGLEHTGFAILLPDESWAAPIRAYLETGKISQWLEHHAERRGDRWILSESLLKMLPIPESFSKTIAREAAHPELREFVNMLVKTPEQVRASASTLSPEVRFIAMSLALREVERAALRIRPYLSTEGRIEWTKLLDLLRISDFVPLTHHTMVRIAGQIPVNSPITKIDRLKAPQNGVLLMTESGALAKILFDHRMLADMAWDQAKVYVHPTWGELVQTVRLPRTLEIAESAANDIMGSHQDLERKRQALQSWLSAGIPES